MVGRLRIQYENKVIIMNNPKKNKELVEAFCTTVFVKHDLSTLDHYMRDDYIQHNLDVPQGKAGFKQFFEATFKAMPDFRYTPSKRSLPKGTLYGFIAPLQEHIQVVNGLTSSQPVTNSTLMLLIFSVFRTGSLPSTGTWQILTACLASLARSTR